jgi:hypothetical protein
MIKQDLIERMSKELAKVLAELLGFDTTQKLEYINEYLSSLSLDPVQILDLDPEDLLDDLLDREDLQVSHLELVGNLIHQKALVYYAQDFDAFGHNMMKKAILVLEHVDEELGIYSVERRELIASMKRDVWDEEIE